jgi:hypothetical protein
MRKVIVKGSWIIAAAVMTHGSAMGHTSNIAQMADEAKPPRPNIAQMADEAKPPRPNVALNSALA